MKNYRELLSKYGFASLIIILGIILFIMAVAGGQNIWVKSGIITVVLTAGVILMSNSGIVPYKFTIVLVAITFAGSMTYIFLDYTSVQNKLDFITEKKSRENRVVKRLIDIRSAQVSYKKLYGAYSGNFNDLINHIKNDSMPVVKAIGTVPDTLTELKAVELGIVTRDTLKLSVRDTLFPKNFPIDSLRYVPLSNGQEFRLLAGEVEKNKLKVKVFEAFADYNKILYGMDLTEDYIDLSKGISVGSMTEPHIRGNWE